MVTSENGDNTLTWTLWDLKTMFTSIMSGEDVIVRIFWIPCKTLNTSLQNKTELTQRVFHEVLSMDDALS